MDRRQALAPWGFSVATGFVVLAAHIWLLSVKSSNHLDWIFLSFLLLDLVPAAVFAVLVRSTSTAIAGPLLLAVTGCPWLFVPFSSNDFALMAPMFGWFAALSIAALAGM